MFRRKSIISLYLRLYPSLRTWRFRRAPDCLARHACLPARTPLILRGFSEKYPWFSLVNVTIGIHMKVLTAYCGIAFGLHGPTLCTRLMPEMTSTTKQLKSDKRQWHRVGLAAPNVAPPSYVKYVIGSASNESSDSSRRWHSVGPLPPSAAPPPYARNAIGSPSN